MTYYLALLFFLFDYLRPGSYIPGLDALHLNALIPTGAILGTLVLKTPVSNRDVFADKNAKIMGVLLFLLVVSTLFASVTFYAFTVTKNVFAYMLISWVIARNVGSMRQLKGIFLMLVGVHIAIAVLNPTLFTNPESRVGINSGAFLGDGNDFSLSLNICIPLALFIMLEARQKFFKFAWIVILIALVLSVVATKSRGGTVALGAIAIYYWLKSDRKVLTASLFILVIVLVVAWAPTTYFDRMGTIGDTTEGSAQGRIMAWNAAIQMALQNPLLGAGAGHFAVTYGSQYRIEGAWLTAHSIYFLLLGEMGVPGIAVLLTFLFSNWANNRRFLGSVSRLAPAEASTATNLLTCTSASLVAFATGGAFLSAAYYPHIYVLSGVLIAARRIVRVQLEGRVIANDAQRESQPGTGHPVTNSVISPEWVPPQARANFRTS